MGEYAEMMLDGTLCECCGEYLGEPTGYPGYCSKKCAQDRGATSKIQDYSNCWMMYVKKSDQLIERFITSIEKAYKADFSEDIRDNFSSQIDGLLKKIYMRQTDGFLSHRGIEKTLENNEKAKKRIKKKKELAA